jgi:hypothetical protein
MRALSIAAILLFTVSLRAGAADAPPKKADPGVKEDLAKLQGTFAHEVRDRQGKSLGRIVKYIKGEREMVVHERADGEVTHAHRADIEIARARNVRLFRFYNAEVIEGPKKGQKFGPGAFVYRIDDDAFTEAMGFFVGQEKSAPVIRVYMRIKDAPPPNEK